jgi:hypothetical protein
MNIAALVLGIVGLVFSFIPCLGMYALPITLLAVILGAIAMRQPKKGMAIAGLVCGMLGTLLAGYWLYVYLTVKDGVSDAFHKAGTDFKRELEKDQKEAKEARERAAHTMPDEPTPPTPGSNDPTPPAEHDDKPAPK